MVYIGHLAEISPDFRKRHGFEVGAFDSHRQVLAGAGLPPQIVFVGSPTLAVLYPAHIYATDRLAVGLRAVKGK